METQPNQKIPAIKCKGMESVQSAADLTLDHIMQARKRIQPYIHETPILTSEHLNKSVGAELFFKCENFQKVGAFKARGACNAVFGLSDKEAERGVATHSSGNHALGVSYAAGRRGIPSYVVMPKTASRAKVDAVIEYGGIITQCAPSTNSRESVFSEIQAQTGAEFIHPYNDLRVIAGQATCAAELIESVNQLDTIVAPIGGGGLISGTCLTVNQLAPQIEIFAAEPLKADDAARSFRAGHIISDDAPETVADGLKVPLKENTWYFLSRYVSDVITATEDEIIFAMRLTWQRLKIVMEPSCAVALAIILKNQDLFKGRRIGIMVTGGNVDLDQLPWIK